MTKKRKQHELTQEEIWDDTALIRSWDEAVEEYKRYHSIQAKGEDIEHALRQAEDDALVAEGKVSDRRGELMMLEAGDDTKEEEQANGKVETDNPDEYDPPPAMVAIENGPAMAHHSEECLPHELDSSSAALPRPEELHPAGTVQVDLLAGVGNMPHSVLRNVPDESLKSLMMAWYFAGYYTGLHDGQRHGQR